MTRFGWPVADPAAGRRARLIGAIAAQPDIAVRPNGDAMVGAGPVMAIALDLVTAPMADQIAGRIECQHVGRGHAAVGLVAGGIGFLLLQGLRPVEDPDIVVLVQAKPNGHGQDPVIGQRLGPIGIGLEPGHHHIAAGLRLGFADQMLIQCHRADDPKSRQASNAGSHQEFP